MRSECSKLRLQINVKILFTRRRQTQTGGQADMRTCGQADRRMCKREFVCTDRQADRQAYTRDSVNYHQVGASKDSFFLSSFLSKLSAQLSWLLAQLARQKKRWRIEEGAGKGSRREKTTACTHIPELRVE